MPRTKHPQLNHHQIAKLYCRITIEKLVAARKLQAEAQKLEKQFLAIRIFALEDVLLWLDLALANKLVGYSQEAEELMEQAQQQKQD